MRIYLDKRFGTTTHLECATETRESSSVVCSIPLSPASHRPILKVHLCKVPSSHLRGWTAAAAAMATQADRTPTTAAGAAQCTSVLEAGARADAVAAALSIAVGFILHISLDPVDISDQDWPPIPLFREHTVQHGTHASFRFLQHTLVFALGVALSR